jgi:hypothetical protein
MPGIEIPGYNVGHASGIVKYQRQSAIGTSDIVTMEFIPSFYQDSPHDF